MASTAEFARYIADQLGGAGHIVCKKMFGEYGLYCDGKLFALICDNCLFFKITPAGRRLAPDLESAPPYAGAKPYFLIENTDDRDFLTRLAVETCRALPEPKTKSKKQR